MKPATRKRFPRRKTAAQPLPFLDYLIHEPEPAVVCCMAPASTFRFPRLRGAVHKLILPQRRPEGLAKRDKDLQQAETVSSVALAGKRSNELRFAWQEAYERGRSWRQLLTAGLGQLGASARDLTLKVIDGRRSMIAGLDLTFSNPPARYDFSRDTVTFAGNALGSAVACAISREALDDHFGTDGLRQDGRVEQFLKNRSKIELMARTKYLSWPVDEPGAVLIKTMDFPKLLKETSTTKPSTPSSGSTSKIRTKR